MADRPAFIDDELWAEMIREVSSWDRRFDGAETVVGNLLELLTEAGLVRPTLVGAVPSISPLPSARSSALKRGGIE